MVTARLPRASLHVTGSWLPMPKSFLPGVRLRSRAEFLAVQGSGRGVSARFMTLLGLRNTCEHDRFGIVASRRVGGAVVRNRAKRRLREIFRQQEPEAGRPSLDIVAIARRELADAPFASVRSDFRTALDRLRKGVQ